MSIIKIQQGDTIHFTVTSIVRDVPSNNPKYKPQHKFIGSTPDDPDAAVFMSTVSAERQLGRLGLTLDSVVGQTIEFAKPGEYVDINRPSGASPAPRAAAPVKQPFTSGPHIPGMDGPRPIATPEYGNVPAQQAAVDALRANRLDGVLNLHDVCVDHSLAVTVKKLTTAGIPVTAADVLSAAATMMIGAQKVGAAA
jgi:hypothetical protein